MRVDGWLAATEVLLLLCARATSCSPGRGLVAGGGWDSGRECKGCGLEGRVWLEALGEKAMAGRVGLPLLSETIWNTGVVMPNSRHAPV